MRPMQICTMMCHFPSLQSKVICYNAGTMVAIQSMPASKTVGLFITCLVDFFRPTVATASLRLLQQAGFQVVISRNQSCCGQVAYNNGDRDTAHAIARKLIYEFRHCDYIVVPSASCAAMITNHYGELFPHQQSLDHLYGYNYHHFNPKEDLPYRADDFRARVYELGDFLHHVAGYQPPSLAASLSGRRAIYHPSCSSLRDSPRSAVAARALLTLAGVELEPMKQAESCCGFGGSFSVDFPDISTRLADGKCYHIVNSHADILLSSDLGCLLQLGGRLTRQGSTIEILHLAEILEGSALHTRGHRGAQITKPSEKILAK